MKKSFLLAAASLLVCFTASQVSAQTTDTTKKTTTTTTTTTTADAGAPDVIGALHSNADYTTAAKAVTAAGLESTLKTGGPYTIFAPNNVAFSKLPAGALDSLMKTPEKLAALLKGHVVNGRYAKADIIKALTASPTRKVELTCLDGTKLTMSISPAKTLLLTNAAGNTAEITLYDLIGGNGVVNGINGILMPTK